MDVALTRLAPAMARPTGSTAAVVVHPAVAAFQLAVVILTVVVTLIVASGRSSRERRRALPDCALRGG